MYHDNNRFCMATTEAQITQNNKQHKLKVQRYYVG